MELSQFSVVSTSVSINEEKNTIVKRYSPNIKINLSLEELKSDIDQYVIKLHNQGIITPNIIDSYIENNEIVYEVEYCGKNIIELGFSIENLNSFKTHLTKMLKVVKLAIDSDLYFDPHVKNFVFNENDEVFYVDFFPPYSDKLKELRLDVAKDSETEIISKNFEYFTKDFLGKHFCGDLLNINKNLVSIFPKIYELEKELGMTKESEETFIKESIAIRTLEDERLEKNIFLL